LLQINHCIDLIMLTLAICLAPYKLTVSTSALYVQTLYGMPNQGKNGGRIIYYIKPKVIEDKYCYGEKIYTRPNLEKI
jgi:hypothetical protein